MNTSCDVWTKGSSICSFSVKQAQSTNGVWSVRFKVMLLYEVVLVSIWVGVPYDDMVMLLAYGICGGAMSAMIVVHGVCIER